MILGENTVAFSISRQGHQFGRARWSLTSEASVHKAPKYQNEAVIHRLTASGRVGTTATVNKRSRDPTGYPANMISSPGADLVLGQRRRHWPSIVSTLARCLLFAGYSCATLPQACVFYQRLV